MGTYTRNKLNYIRMIKMTRKKIMIIIKYTILLFLSPPSCTSTDNLQNF